MAFDQSISWFQQKVRKVFFIVMEQYKIVLAVCFHVSSGGMILFTFRAKPSDSQIFL